MKKISAGTIIVNEKSQILMGKVTNSNPVYWDLPKGTIDPGETPLQAAIRESMEEFSFDLSKYNMIDLGLRSYNREKNIHVFLQYIPLSDVDMSSLNCTSTFYDERRKSDVLEIDGYKWIDLSDVVFECAPSMSRLINSLISEIEQESKYGEYRK